MFCEAMVELLDGVALRVLAFEDLSGAHRATRHDLALNRFREILGADQFRKAKGSFKIVQEAADGPFFVLVSPNATPVGKLAAELQSRGLELRLSSCASLGDCSVLDNKASNQIVLPLEFIYLKDLDAGETSLLVESLVQGKVNEQLVYRELAVFFPPVFSLEASPKQTIGEKALVNIEASSGDVAGLKSKRLHGSESEADLLRQISSSYESLRLKDATPSRAESDHKDLRDSLLKYLSATGLEVSASSDNVFEIILHAEQPGNPAFGALASALRNENVRAVWDTREIIAEGSETARPSDPAEDAALDFSEPNAFSNPEKTFHLPFRDVFREAPSSRTLATAKIEHIGDSSALRELKIIEMGLENEASAPFPHAATRLEYLRSLNDEMRRLHLMQHSVESSVYIDSHRRLKNEMESVAAETREQLKSAIGAVTAIGRLASSRSIYVEPIETSALDPIFLKIEKGVSYLDFALVPRRGEGGGSWHFRSFDPQLITVLSGKLANGDNDAMDNVYTAWVKSKLPELQKQLKGIETELAVTEKLAAVKAYVIPGFE